MRFRTSFNILLIRFPPTLGNLVEPFDQSRMFLEADVALWGSIEPIKAAGTDVDAVEPWIFGMTFFVRSVQHGAAASSAEAPLNEARRSIPRDIVLSLDEIELP